MYCAEHSLPQEDVQARVQSEIRMDIYSSRTSAPNMLRGSVSSVEEKPGFAGMNIVEAYELLQPTIQHEEEERRPTNDSLADVGNTTGGIASPLVDEQQI
jgi:hypothetical protein